MQPDEPTEYTYHPSGGTGPVPDEEVYLKLRENRKKKIKDFVLLGEEEEVDDADADTDDEEDGDKVSDEFESMADAPSVLEDLKELSASISIRFVLLLILFILNLYPVLANVFSVLPLPHLLRAGENPMFYSLVSLIILLVWLYLCGNILLLGAAAGWVWTESGSGRKRIEGNRQKTKERN